MWRTAGGDRWLRGPHKRTPSESLGPKPGERVRVKTRAQVVDTLDRNTRNRGMATCDEVLRCCGGEAEVRYRVDRLIDERTGLMREISCLCYHELGDCPRGELMYWREIRLERLNRSGT